jgi:hypothetical protein
VLTWNTTNANTVTISPTVGSVSGSGSYTVTPSYTTTYTLTATNSDGSVSASTTVTVAPYVSGFINSSGSAIASAGTGDGSGTGGVFTLGFGGSNNPMLLYILIGLLAVAAVGAVVFVARRPVAVASGAHSGTRVGRQPWTTTRVADGIPHTTPVATGPGPKFVLSDGVHIPISGNAGALGRSDFRSLVKADEADLISREHLRFDCEGDECFIEDRRSTNGTKINGSKIKGKGRFLLRDGDTVELADVLTFTYKN